MCIIVYAPKDISISKETLENCFDNNPDGSGFMYQTNDSVFIQKGFMSFPAFWRAWSSVPETADRIAHFRIATSGKISEGVCHPFPIVENFNEMRKTKVHSPIAFVHNGILSRYTPKDHLKSDYSDTMAFCQLALDPLKDQLDNVALQDLIEETGSRFAIMWPDKVALLGSFEQKDGCFFSNGTYKYSYKSYSKPDLNSYRYNYKSRKTTYTKMAELCNLYDMICFENIPKSFDEITFIRSLERHNPALFIEPEMICKVNPGLFFMANNQEEVLEDGLFEGYLCRSMTAKDLVYKEVREWIDDLYDYAGMDDTEYLDETEELYRSMVAPS